MTELVRSQSHGSYRGELWCAVFLRRNRQNERNAKNFGGG